MDILKELKEVKKHLHNTDVGLDNYADRDDANTFAIGCISNDCYRAKEIVNKLIKKFEKEGG